MLNSGGITASCWQGKFKRKWEVTCSLVKLLWDIWVLKQRRSLQAAWKKKTTVSACATQYHYPNFNNPSDKTKQHTLDHFCKFLLAGIWYPTITKTWLKSKYEQNVFYNYYKSKCFRLELSIGGFKTTGERIFPYYQKNSYRFLTTYKNIYRKI